MDAALAVAVGTRTAQEAGPHEPAWVGQGQQVERACVSRHSRATGEPRGAWQEEAERTHRYPWAEEGSRGTQRVHPQGWGDHREKAPQA